jgi:ABC-type Mn2+/Zn2+ transport system permease subunit
MNDIWQHLLTPLHYDYMLRAMLVCGLVGATGGFLSSFITLKGWSLMGDALSHAVVPGVALAYLAGLPFSVGAFSTGLLAAWAMAIVKKKTALREDAVIGIIFTSFFALGLLLISLFPTRVDIRTILFGNILGIAGGDVTQMVIVAAVTFAVLGLKWRDLLLVSFDPAQARALGMPVFALQTLLLALLAAAAVAALQAVGACLVVAVLVTPGATAYLLTDNFGKMILISSLLGTITGVTGAYASYFVDGATGGCIVTLQAAIFVLVWIFAPRHGLIASRRRRADAMA